MRIVIVGANGQLGSDLSKVLAEYKPICLTHQDIELSCSLNVEKVFKKYHPHLLINTAAFNNVALCEEEAEKAFQVNTLGVKNLSEYALLYNTILVHISTDYVFDGKKKKPYTEEDLPFPVNVYGLSKLAGEYIIRYKLKKFFIIRTSALFGTHICRGKGGNFLDKIFDLYKRKKEIIIVNDEFVSPTYSLDLAKQIKEIIKTTHYGIFHAAGEGFCSWYKFGKTFFDFLGIKIKIIPAKAQDFQQQVKRPHFSALENKRLKDLKINCMRHWKDALRDYIREKF